MARPTKPRSIRRFPASTTYQPLDQGARESAVEIGYDEFEALRLTDVEHMSQEEVAQMMDISRQSIQLMLQTAREKLTRALFEGQTILIGGGHIEVYHCPYICLDCHQSFSIPATDPTRDCPACGSANTRCNSDAFCALHCQIEVRSPQEKP